LQKQNITLRMAYVPLSALLAKATVVSTNSNLGK